MRKALGPEVKRKGSAIEAVMEEYAAPSSPPKPKKERASILLLPIVPLKKASSAAYVDNMMHGQYLVQIENTFRAGTFEFDDDGCLTFTTPDGDITEFSSAKYSGWRAIWEIIER